jgi:type IV pilus assembly protein PilB
MELEKESPIGNLLLRAGLIDPEGLARAREAQQKEGTSLARAIVALGLADSQSVAAAIGKSLKLEVLNAELPEVSAEAMALLSGEFCRARKVVPLRVEAKSLHLAVEDPLDYGTTQDVEFRTGKRVFAVIATPDSIQTLLTRTYPLEEQAPLESFSSGEPQGEMEALGDTDLDVVDPAKLAQDTQMPPVVRLVNLILGGAAKEGASDIHMEPKEGFVQVRYRVDGLLRDVLKIPKAQQEATISRIKIISGMDITERRRPQDGRSRLRFEGKRIDLRVSTLPTNFGEKVVIRLLDSRRAQITIDQMGLSPENLHNLQLMLSLPQGMILVTGPTGSGKSSTLYTALGWVKSPTKNIITVEDPIEYQIEGVNQVQINTKAGITFAAGLRSILRQDPNVILVGEIRDRETAGIALEAAQTGHLLLSTLHTNDAPATISRLLDLEIEPFLIASALIGILAQRLVRRPCGACVKPANPSEEVLEKLGGSSRLPDGVKWIAGAGCPECNQSGYKGRLAIHELLVVNDEIRDQITKRAAEHAIRNAARSSGMRTLLEDGIAKAAKGLTTLDEVVRVAAGDDKARKADSANPESNAQPVAAQGRSGEPVTVSREPLGPAPPASAEEPSGPGHGERVLVVEDSGTIQKVIRYFLELEGFQVLEASDGAAWLETAKRERPHAIVTDYNMPGMDGVTMVKALRSDPSTRDIAVLVLTSENSVECETRALSGGADDYILKPVEPRRLAARVKALLARAKGRQPATSSVT